MYFEHVTEGIDYAFGVGPVDALMNAMYFVRRRFHEFEDVTPPARPPAVARRPRASKKRVASKRAKKA